MGIFSPCHTEILTAGYEIFDLLASADFLTPSSKDLFSLYGSDDNVVDCACCLPAIASRSGEAGGRLCGPVVLWSHFTIGDLEEKLIILWTSPLFIRGGGIPRNQVADWIGTGWRDQSEWGGAIGRNTQTVDFRMRS